MEGPVCARRQTVLRLSHASASWDEWVDETRILKYNDENLQLQAAALALVAVHR